MTDCRAVNPASGLPADCRMACHPRSAHFKEDIIQAFYGGTKHKPETTFGNVKAKTVADQFAEALAAAGVKRGTSLRESKSPRRSLVWP